MTAFDQTYESWRNLAREYITKGVSPSEIHWQHQAQEQTLFSEQLTHAAHHPIHNPHVSREFLDLAEVVSCARADDRWALLYRLLYRIQFENHNLLKITVDNDVHRASLLYKSVRHDIHKMHAFVRFKHVVESDLYVAWHKPEHIIYKIGTPFFARRFGDKKWSIYTPDGSAHWDLHELKFGPGLLQNEFQVRDEWDEVWKTYYKSIFNPARIKIKAMKTEMSPKYWSSMPETELINELVRSAPLRLQTMKENKNIQADVDQKKSLTALKKEAEHCKACPLYKSATQTVFGEGDQHAKIMIVGEQPGDQEDKAGHPFVGPAGAILDHALERAGLSRDEIYITNAVKHFKWQQSGKARLHKKPNGSEIHACKPWLEAEIAKVKPEIIIALGTTAGLSVLGRLPKITDERGQLLNNFNSAKYVMVSWHPAAILRAGSDEASAEKKQQLIDDLKKAVKAISKSTSH